ncbi:flagellar assembly protein H [Virgibacillus dokdonensis]|uniref:Flagellar assembly protein FliH n=1 Tax=Virgibacillus dokdonensis TaxID=302167 RepID=A0A2K9J645_9BACI|nr:flagellar assembly protein H [Virgibacillus dokdonensis]
MISLSNPSRITERKQIRIKPVSVFQPSNTHVKEAHDKSELDQELLQAEQALEQLREQRQQLIKQTKREIEAEKGAWQEERQKYVEAAKEEGFQAGFSEGKSEALTTYKAYVDHANHLVESAKHEYYSLIEEHEETIMEIAIHTAEKIIKQEIVADHKSFLPIIQAAIKELKDQSEIALYLHPNQYAFVVQHKEELSSLIEPNAKLMCYVSDEIEENGCMIKYPYGQVDVGVDTQLEEIGKALIELAGEGK